MEDTQIIALYWQRSSDAIRASEEAYGAYCFTVANRIVENREDAEECVSDTWLRAWYAMPPEKDIARRFGKRVQKAVHTGGKLRRNDGILNLR